MAGLQQWIIGLIMIGLFTIAIIMYAVGFASDNDAEIDISDDTQVYGLVSQQTTNLSSFSESGASTYTSIANSSIGSGGQTTQTAGAFTISPASATGVIKNIFLTGYIKIFGTNNGFSIFMITFFGVISMITAFLVWKAWVGGQPN